MHEHLVPVKTATHSITLQIRPLQLHTRPACFMC